MRASILLLAFVIGCGGSSTETRLPRIQCLGDSITDGVGSTDGGGYRSRLSSLLDGRVVWVGSLKTPFAPHDGHRAKDTQYLIDNAGQWIAQNKPDVILIMTGHNDKAGSDYAGLYRRLLEVVSSKPGMKVYFATPFPNKAKTDSAKCESQSLAIQGLKSSFPNLAIVDVKTGYHGYSDNNHPDDVGYQLIAERFYQALR